MMSSASFDRYSVSVDDEYGVDVEHLWQSVRIEEESEQCGVEEQPRLPRILPPCRPTHPPPYEPPVADVRLESDSSPTPHFHYPPIGNCHMAGDGHALTHTTIPLARCNSTHSHLPSSGSLHSPLSLSLSLSSAAPPSSTSPFDSELSSPCLPAAFSSLTAGSLNSAVPTRGHLHFDALADLSPDNHTTHFYSPTGDCDAEQPYLARHHHPHAMPLGPPPSIACVHSHSHSTQRSDAARLHTAHLTHTHSHTAGTTRLQHSQQLSHARQVNVSAMPAAGGVSGMRGHLSERRADLVSSDSQSAHRSPAADGSCRSPLSVRRYSSQLRDGEIAIKPLLTGRALSQPAFVSPVEQPLPIFRSSSAADATGIPHLLPHSPSAADLIAHYGSLLAATQYARPAAVLDAATVSRPQAVTRAQSSTSAPITRSEQHDHTLAQAAVLSSSSLPPPYRLLDVSSATAAVVLASSPVSYPPLLAASSKRRREAVFNYLSLSGRATSSSVSESDLSECVVSSAAPTAGKRRASLSVVPYRLPATIARRLSLPIVANVGMGDSMASC